MTAFGLGWRGEEEGSGGHGECDEHAGPFVPMLGGVKAAGKMKDDHPDEEHEAGKAMARESNSVFLREMTNRGATQIPFGRDKQAKVAKDRGWW